MNIVDSSHSFVQRLISSTAVYHVSDELHQQITDAWRLLRQEDSEERLLDGLIKLLPANNIRRYMAANVAVDERGEQVYAPRNISLKHGVLNNSVTDLSILDVKFNILLIYVREPKQRQPIKQSDESSDTLEELRYLLRSARTSIFCSIVDILSYGEEDQGPLLRCLRSTCAFTIQRHQPLNAPYFWRVEKFVRTELKGLDGQMQQFIMCMTDCSAHGPCHLCHLGILIKLPDNDELIPSGYYQEGASMTRALLKLHLNRKALGTRALFPKLQNKLSWLSYNITFKADESGFNPYHEPTPFEGLFTPHEFGDTGDIMPGDLDAVVEAWRAQGIRLEYYPDESLRLEVVNRMAQASESEDEQAPREKRRRS